MRQETYARHLGVILVVLLEPPGDEQPEPLLARASAAVVDTIRGAGGDAEPLAIDRVTGAFDTAAAGVATGLRLVASGGELARVGVRVGLHAGDTVTSDAGHALRDVVAEALRLAARAPARGVCVSDTIARSITRTLDAAVQDLGAPGPGEVRAYLVVAREPATRWARRRVLGGVAAALLLAGGAGVVGLARRRASRPADEGIVLGVMPFKAIADDARHTGLRTALRDAVNTQLSFVAGVKVYSREFLDFLVTRQGLTEYEAASRLGIRKALMGTVSAPGADVRVEVQIVDIATGTLDSSVVVVGRDDALIDLESDVAHAVIDRLGIPLTRADTHRLQGFRATDAGAYRRFLETEGEVVGGLPAPVDEPGPQDGPSSWLLPRSAWAEDTGARQEVVAFLERYRRAIERGDLDTLAELYLEFPPEQRAALVRYYKDSRDLRVVLEDVDVAVAGHEAIVSYTRKDDFVDAPTGRAMHVSGRVTKLLRRTDGGWRLAPGR